MYQTHSGIVCLAEIICTGALASRNKGRLAGGGQCNPYTFPSVLLHSGSPALGGLKKRGPQDHPGDIIQCRSSQAEQLLWGGCWGGTLLNCGQSEILSSYSVGKSLGAHTHTRSTHTCRGKSEGSL